jgi:hypothetical protein
MSTSTTPKTVRVPGTPFELVAVPVLWDEGSVCMLGDEVRDDFDHNLGRSTFDFYFGDEEEALVDDLPVCGEECEPMTAWGLRAPGSEVFLSVLWRKDDCEYVARQLHGAFPAAWDVHDGLGIRVLHTSGAAGWLDLVTPLLNRGCPRGLLVDCRQFVEAAARQ